MDVAWWEQIKAAGASPPGTDLAGLVTRLEGMLGVPDAHVRDELAFEILGGWVMAGTCDGDLAGIGDRMTAALATGLGEACTDTVFGRSFAALVLGLVIERDNTTLVLDVETVERWREAVLGWFLAERDLRGVVDPERGVAHAVAHGADVIASLARHRHVSAAHAGELLDAIVARLSDTAGVALLLSEDERLAYGAMALLHRGDVPAGRLATALAPITALAGQRHRTDLDPAAYARLNTLNWLRALHLQLEYRVRAMPWYADDRHFTAPPPQQPEKLALIADCLRGFSLWLAEPTAG